MQRREAQPDLQPEVEDQEEGRQAGEEDDEEQQADDEGAIAEQRGHHQRVLAPGLAAPFVDHEDDHHHG